MGNFLFNLNRVAGSVITIAVAILTAFILTPWALLLGIPLLHLALLFYLNLYGLT